MEEWSKDIDALVEIAQSEPQLAYTAYVYGTSRRWQFVCRTTPEISAELTKLEEMLKCKLIPAIFGNRTISDDLRKIIRLPARLGGLGLQNPAEEADHEYQNSKIMTSQLTQAIFAQHRTLVIDQQLEEEALKTVKANKEDRITQLKDELTELLSPDMHKLIALSAEKGASIWLSSLPLKDCGFRLGKQEFADAFRLVLVLVS